EAGDLFVNRVDPERAGQLAEKLLVILPRFVTWQRLEIEDDHVARAEAFAARIDEPRRSQHVGDRGALFAFILRVAIGLIGIVTAVWIGVGVFRRFLCSLALFPFFFSFSLFDLADALLDVFLRVGLFLRRERLAVFCDQAADAGAFVKGQLERLALLDLHLAVRLKLAFGDHLGVGVFFEQTVDLVLVLPDLLQ